MKYLGEADEKRKLCLIQTWGGPELIEYMTRVAKVNFEDIPAVGDAGGIKMTHTPKPWKRLQKSWQNM